MINKTLRWHGYKSVLKCNCWMPLVTLKSFFKFSTIWWRWVKKEIGVAPHFSFFSNGSFLLCTHKYKILYYFFFMFLKLFLGAKKKEALTNLWLKMTFFFFVLYVLEIFWKKKTPSDCLSTKSIFLYGLLPFF